MAAPLCLSLDAVEKVGAVCGPAFWRVTGEAGSLAVLRAMRVRDWCGFGCEPGLYPDALRTC